ncbi:odv-e25 [Cryptophlebia peltastica nucleopolyhedrovirus]|uniref:Odv-e25 n=1 Tax=Cryptophlebia peltastica nucleopolyhedrovirus TaxID=2304025 RepID=A0A346RNU2_9ABAC|nr:odv-e25 [Cryptophlebia peltastica nucleopolyhedrovirus]AXS67739.1 odv-e25 [Cryptophlebia peltastica nucleopolyhedrovirus]
MTTIILIVVVLVVLYFLYVNNKLPLNSLNESSPSINQSSDSVQLDPATGQYAVKLNNSKIKSFKILHGDNHLSRLYVSERPLTYNEIIDEGNRTAANSYVFVGTVSDPATLAGATSTSRTTLNFKIEQFKNVFLIFKNLDFNKIKESVNMTRYECEGMVYCLIDPNTSTVPDLRDVSYPITVYTTNVNAQLKLKEWDYAEVNEAGTLFIKNEKSFRIQ